MTVHKDAGAAAMQAYLRALEGGADRETALDVALAKLRATLPLSDEWELRTSFAKLLASERQRASHRSP